MTTTKLVVATGDGSNPPDVQHEVELNNGFPPDMFQHGFFSGTANVRVFLVPVDLTPERLAAVREDVAQYLRDHPDSDPNDYAIPGIDYTTLRLDLPHMVFRPRPRPSRP